MTKILATKARNALWLQFFVMGVVSMAWVPRIPEMKTANELSDTQFGLVSWQSYSGKADYLEFPANFVDGLRFRVQLAAMVNFTFTPSA